MAPFSFFNAVSTDPPILMFSAVHLPKDTPANVRETGEFAIHTVTEDLLVEMDRTSESLPPDGSEFETAGIEFAPCELINVRRITDAAIAFECTLYERFPIKDAAEVFFGRVEYVHVADAVTTDGKLDVTKLAAVGRLAGNQYASTRDRLSMKRPEEVRTSDWYEFDA